MASRMALRMLCVAVLFAVCSASVSQTHTTRSVSQAGSTGSATQAAASTGSATQAAGGSTGTSTQAAGGSTGTSTQAAGGSTGTSTQAAEPSPTATAGTGGATMPATAGTMPATAGTVAPMTAGTTGGVVTTPPATPVGTQPATAGTSGGVVTPPPVVKTPTPTPIPAGQKEVVKAEFTVDSASPDEFRTSGKLAKFIEDCKQLKDGNGKALVADCFVPPGLEGVKVKSQKIRVQVPLTITALITPVAGTSPAAVQTSLADPVLRNAAFDQVAVIGAPTTSVVTTPATPPPPVTTPPANPLPPAAPAAGPSASGTITVQIEIVILGTRSAFTSTEQNALTSAVGAAVNGTAAITDIDETSTARKFTMQASALRVTMTVTAPAAQYPTLQAIIARINTVIRQQNGRIGNSSVVTVTAANPGAAAGRSGPVAMTLLVAMLVALLF